MIRATERFGRCTIRTSEPCPGPVVTCTDGRLWSFYFGREATLMDEIGEVGVASPPEIRLTVLLGALGKELRVSPTSQQRRADSSYTPHHYSTAAVLQQIDKALTEFDLSLSLAARMEASPQTM